MGQTCLFHITWAMCFFAINFFHYLEFTGKIQEMKEVKDSERALNNIRRSIAMTAYFNIVIQRNYRKLIGYANILENSKPCFTSRFLVHVVTRVSIDQFGQQWQRNDSNNLFPLSNFISPSINFLWCHLLIQ